MRNAFEWIRVTAIALFAVYLTAAPGMASESVVLNSHEIHKLSDHVSLGIQFFGSTFLSFEKPNERNTNNIDGFNQISVWDSGKLITISVSEEQWQETRARTTHGCVPGRRLAKARFTIDVQPNCSSPDT